MDAPQVNLELNNSVVLNYVIVRRILGYLNWRDLEIAEQVCQFWADTITNLRKENVIPQTYYSFSSKMPSSFNFVLSHETRIEPLLALTFYASEVQQINVDCNKPTTTMCKAYSCSNKRNCHKHHKVLEFIHSTLTYPHNRIMAIQCNKVFYTPTINKRKANGGPINLSGICIPKIKNVSHHIIDMPLESCLLTENRNPGVKTLLKLMETEIIKCILVYACERNHMHRNDFTEMFLTVVKERQGDRYPFAVGGCIIKDTTMKNFVSYQYTYGTGITIVLMTVLKEEHDTTPFDCYSLIMHEKKNSDIDAIFKEIAERIPKRSYNVAYKMTCVDRMYLHDFECSMFSKHFPNIPMIGCDAMGEIGVNFLPKIDQNESGESKSKKPRIEFESNFYDFMHSDSTSLVIFSWE